MCRMWRMERNQRGFFSWNAAAYVEDCQVCCKPNILQVSWDMSAGEYTISAELE